MARRVALKEAGGTQTSSLQCRRAACARACANALHARLRASARARPRAARGSGAPRVGDGAIGLWKVVASSRHFGPLVRGPGHHRGATDCVVCGAPDLAMRQHVPSQSLSLLARQGWQDELCTRRFTSRLNGAHRAADTMHGVLGPCSGCCKHWRSRLSGAAPMQTSAPLQGPSCGAAMMCVPQRPYMVLGSLRQQLLYPAFHHRDSDGSLPVGAEESGSPPRLSDPGASKHESRVPPSDAELERMLSQVLRCRAIASGLRVDLLVFTSARRAALTPTRRGVELVPACRWG